mmetsp:Transcript_10410/g.18857  ORF Transcript_10410/g.18857 Transcript_10410/m.18857 type:complete len:207 (-) Transcript_10410:590-1210(-)
MDSDMGVRGASLRPARHSRHLAGRARDMGASALQLLHQQRPHIADTHPPRQSGGYPAAAAELCGRHGIRLSGRAVCEAAAQPSSEAGVQNIYRLLFLPAQLRRCHPKVVQQPRFRLRVVSYIHKGGLRWRGGLVAAAAVHQPPLCPDAAPSKLRRSLDDPPPSSKAATAGHNSSSDKQRACSRGGFSPTQLGGISASRTGDWPTDG